MEQMCFDMDVSDERRAFELLYPHISDLIYDAPIDSGVLLFREIENCSSIYFLNPSLIFFQIRLRKKTRYLLIPEEYSTELPSNTHVSRTKSANGMVRVSINSPEDIILYVHILRTILNRIARRYQIFGCCSRYEACSDAKKCIHPDIKTALGCQYRQNLIQGKIFYGKNRNTN